MSGYAGISIYRYSQGQAEPYVEWRETRHRRSTQPWSGRYAISLPDVTITTDMIVGFPGETNEEFTESLDLVREIGFDGGHVFTYSSREGTPAARYSDQIPLSLKKERSQKMRNGVIESGMEIRKRLLDQVVPVLWEGMRKVGENEWKVAGLTANNHRVVTQIDRVVTNQVLPARLLEVTDEGFLGEIVTP